jgi:hypothetical protein
MKFIYLSIFLTSNAFAATPPRNETTVPLGEAGVKNLGIETIAAEESTFEQNISLAVSRVKSFKSEFIKVSSSRKVMSYCASKAASQVIHHRSSI